MKIITITGGSLYTNCYMAYAEDSDTCVLIDPGFDAEQILEKVRAQVKRVKELRATLLYGDFHRLLSPYEGNDTAWITVSKDKNEAVFMFVRAQHQPAQPPRLVRLRGLDEGKTYTICETGESYTGAELMHLGLSVQPGWGDAASVSLTLKAE